MLLTKGKVEILGLCHKTRSQTQPKLHWLEPEDAQAGGRESGGQTLPRGNEPPCQGAPGHLREGLSPSLSLTSSGGLGLDYEIASG